MLRAPVSARRPNYRVGVSAVIVILVLLGAAAVGYLVYQAHQRRIAYIRALAAKYGFTVDIGPKDPPDQPFDLFDQGHAKKVRYHMWRHGSQDSVFQYEYTTGSGDNKTTHKRTCALIDVPFVAAHTKIGPEGFWSKIGRAVGMRDIEVESAEFNEQYRVTGDDERFAITLLDQQMMAWLLSSQSGRGAIRFELGGPWLLCVSDELDIELMFGYLDWAIGVRNHMPPVLTSLYPRR